MMACGALSGLRLSCLLPVLLLLGGASICSAQSTSGIISGRVFDVESRGPLRDVVIVAAHMLLPASAQASSGPDGFYSLPPLPAGDYQVRAARTGYQSAELNNLELTVAGRAELDFELRSLDTVWESGPRGVAFLPGRFLADFYGPDVALFSRYLTPVPAGSGTLEATLSRVIDPAQLRELPFSGRDLFTMLVTAPGVSADAATARGLGLAANGQRTSSTHFLLDGVDANNLLVGGPLLAVAPEAAQEYRISTANWSAEYGNASGLLANAVTRAGGDNWHGLAYVNLKNDALNANGFQDNLNGWKRRSFKELQPGFHVGGPLRAKSLFLSVAAESLRLRNRQAPVQLRLPSTDFLPLYTQPSSAARQLLQRFPAPPVSDSRLPAALLTVEPPLSIDRALTLLRLDAIIGSHRLTGRLARSSTTRPNFIWTPYPDFVSSLKQPAPNYLFSITSSFRPHLTGEFRAGWSQSRIGWNRPHPEIPTFSASEGVILPGSPAFYEFDYRGRQWEFLEHFVWTRGRHIVKFGGGVLLRKIDGALTAGRDGRYRFGTIVDFAVGRPTAYSVSVARDPLPILQPPKFDNAWSLNQYSGFIQDSVRLSPRVTVNAGLRTENFGAPSAAGEQLLRLGASGSFPERIASGVLTTAGADERLYPNRWNWAPRLGISFDPFASGQLVVRAGFGLFHDRLLDNLWQNVRANSIVVKDWPFRGPDHSFLAPISQTLPLYATEFSSNDFPGVTAFDRDLTVPYARSLFLSLETRAASNWKLQAAVQSASGNRLLSTDQVNRPFSLSLEAAGPGNPDRTYNARLPLISYRANLARSSYHALALSAAYRGRSSQFHLAYTWSHAIDNQSDPLSGDFFDLDFTRLQPVADRRVAAFSRQFDIDSDRGNADFDQRHNLVCFSIWELPAPSGWAFLRGWRLSHLAGFRAGFPYSVYAASSIPDSGGNVINNRADVVNPPGAGSGSSSAAMGGLLILEPAAFRQPLEGQLGNLGRNALVAPGFFNVDLSLARSFAVPFLGEAGSLTLRADIFNFLNHANLDTPEGILSSPTFGIALYGRRGATSNFPALAPFVETGRQVQLLLRVRF